MEMLRALHSCVMIHRTLLGLAVSACLLACVGSTTSLGGPRGDQSSVSSTDKDEDGDAASGSPGQLANDDDAGSGGFQFVGIGYTWAPVPSSEACQYLLPSGFPSDSDPDYDPARWDPRNVVIEVFGVTPQEERVGQYKATSAGCGQADGWYYVDPAERQPPTLFALCPATCAYAANEGALVRLTAWKPN